MNALSFLAFQGLLVLVAGFLFGLGFFLAKKLLKA